MENPRKLSKIKTSFLARGLRLAKMTISTSSSLAAHGLSTLLSDEDEKASKWKDFLKARAKHFSQELGDLKGSLMKAGQMLSMYGEHFLPPEANEMLKSLQSKSPPLEWTAIEKVLKTRLTEDQLSQLEIDPESIGTASLGQVHKARIKKTGQWIALKVQYPGVDKAIDSDLRAIRSFLSVLKLLPKGMQTDQIFAEVRGMLTQEMDYSQEAKSTIEYRERLIGDSRFILYLA